MRRNNSPRRGTQPRDTAFQSSEFMIAVRDALEGGSAAAVHPEPAVPRKDGLEASDLVKIGACFSDHKQLLF